MGESELIRMAVGGKAIVEFASFTLGGKDKKSLRNMINSLQKKGYILAIHKAPHATPFLQMS